MDWGCTGSRCGQGVFTGIDGVIGDAGRVYHMDDTKMVHLWGVWGEQGGWDTLWGCSGESRCMSHCSGAAVLGPEWGRAGEMAIVNDMAGRMDK